MNTPQRIILFGLPGAGKSTFAVRLAKKLGLPLHHIDKYYFVRKWVRRDYDDFCKLQEKMTADEKWIIDGNDIRSLEVRYKRATIAIYFRYPRWRCLWRLIKRTIHKDPTIDDRTEDIPEQLRWAVVRAMWLFHTRRYPVIARLREKYPNVAFVEVHNDRELQQLEDSLA